MAWGDDAGPLSTPITEEIEGKDPVEEMRTLCNTPPLSFTVTCPPDWICRWWRRFNSSEHGRIPVFFWNVAVSVLSDLVSVLMWAMGDLWIPLSLLLSWLGFLLFRCFYLFIYFSVCVCFWRNAAAQAIDKGSGLSIYLPTSLYMSMGFIYILSIFFSPCVRVFEGKATLI